MGVCSRCHEKYMRVVDERDKARADYRFMVERAADEKQAAELKRLREALEFYAKEESWCDGYNGSLERCDHPHDNVVGGPPLQPDALHDAGDIAREVLAATRAPGEKTSEPSGDAHRASGGGLVPDVGTSCPADAPTEPGTSPTAISRALQYVESLRLAAVHRESPNGSCCCPACAPGAWTPTELAEIEPVDVEQWIRRRVVALTTEGFPAAPAAPDEAERKAREFLAPMLDDFCASDEEADDVVESLAALLRARDAAAEQRGWDAAVEELRGYEPIGRSVSHAADWLAARRPGGA